MNSDYNFSRRPWEFQQLELLSGLIKQLESGITASRAAANHESGLGQNFLPILRLIIKEKFLMNRLLIYERKVLIEFLLTNILIKFSIFYRTFDAGLRKYFIV